MRHEANNRTGRGRAAGVTSGVTIRTTGALSVPANCDDLFALAKPLRTQRQLLMSGRCRCFGQDEADDQNDRGGGGPVGDKVVGGSGDIPGMVNGNGMAWPC